ncbi:hypothetical protein JAAARDRAFT_209762 [Jaapia argillacea MUCL 33604]|uniref:F-box domain-containing protein n=1 Tax=Jaapia argillacea MUCL 33604 TaxID=933084 RepID=A0A067PTP7_9AGAM|nr:hypothetical protein JAAARDRAFT_209762 [Jaapia argillacea MUCL 33604]
MLTWVEFGAYATKFRNAMHLQLNRAFPRLYKTLIHTMHTPHNPLTLAMTSYHKLPVELWAHISGFLSRSGLYNVLQTNRLFHDIALPILYRSIIWNDPVDVANHLPFWDSHPEMKQIPRSLVFAVSPPRCICEEFGPQVAVADGRTNAAITTAYRADLRSHHLDLLPHSATHYTQYDQPEVCASPQLHYLMCTMITSFQHLEMLAFRNTILPETFFATIHSLPSLRTLHLQGVILPEYAPDSVQNNRNLPITELTLWGLDNLEPSGNARFFPLATASNLRTLRVDSTARVFAWIINKEFTGSVVAPSKLTNIYLRILKGQPHDTLSCPGLFVMSLLWFLGCHGSALPLERLSISGYGQNVGCLFPDVCLPPLSYLRVPLDLIVPILGKASQNLESLDISEGIVSTRDLTNTLSELGCSKSTRNLGLALKSWDEAILPVITQLFPGLKSLKMTYWSSDGPWIVEPPSDLHLIGPKCLAHLRSLETFQLYSVSPPPDHYIHLPPIARQHPLVYATQSQIQSRPFFDGDHKVKDLLAEWSEFSESLVEVKFEPARVWRRAGPGQEWDVRAVHIPA